MTLQCLIDKSVQFQFQKIERIATDGNEIDGKDLIILIFNDSIILIFDDSVIR